MNSEIIGLLGTAFLMGGYVPYLYALYRKQAKPHAFSWLLWGVMNAIVCAVQVTENAGPGAWTSGIATIFNFGIGIYALKYGERNIAKADWVILLSVLLALPLWAVTKNPVWSVILVSVLDTLAFLPTFRKSWHRPNEEVATTFFMGMIGYGLAWLAVDNASFANICFPAKVVVVNGLFVALLLYRRHALSNRGKLAECQAAA